MKWRVCLEEKHVEYSSSKDKESRHCSYTAVAEVSSDLVSLALPEMQMHLSTSLIFAVTQLLKVAFLLSAGTRPQTGGQIHNEIPASVGACGQSTRGWNAKKRLHSCLCHVAIVCF